MRYLALAAALAIGGTAMAQDTAPSGTPERDARGIPVVSDPATAPSGANQAPPSGPAVPAPNQQQVFTPQASSKEYPVCSRSVTDGCVQSYERGRSPS